MKQVKVVKLLKGRPGWGFWEMEEQKKNRAKMNGTCYLCGGIFGRSVMTRHLTGCKLKH